MKITVEKPTAERIATLGARGWPTWECAPSTFDYHYDEREICLFLEGQVTVKTADGEVAIGAGDLVTFPAGLDCVWQVHEAVRKHYRFG